MDSSAEEAFDRLARLAAAFLRAPVAQVNLVDADRQFSKSSVGPGEWSGPRSVPLDLSYCRHVVSSGEPLLVEDAREHPLVRDNRATTESGIVAYAAVPLTAEEGHALGTLCVVDFEPRAWDDADVGVLRDLADSVLTELRLRGDIRRREETEAALRRSEQQFRQLAEGIREVFYVTDVQLTEMLYVSPAFEEVWGRSREALHENPLSIVEAIHPEDRHRFGERLARVQRGEEVGEVEYRILLPGGEVRWLRDRPRPVRNGRGEVYRIVGIAEDVTERKRVEGALRRARDELEDRVRERTAEVAEADRALRESEERYRTLFDSGNDAVFVFEIRPDGTYTNFLEVNRTACERLGYTREELLRLSPLDLCPPGSAPDMGDVVQRLLRERRIITERVHVARNETPIPVEVSSRLVELEGDLTVISVARDITERKEAERALHESEQQLHQAQKMEAVGRLAGGIAHDFNNILTAIKASSEFLLMDLPEADPSREDAREIRSAADRAAMLTRQLLAFSRKQVLQPRVLDLNEVVRETESLLRRMIGEDVELITRLDPDLGRVEADPGQIGQVLMNLAINARDAMPDGGKLILETRNVRFGEEAESVSPFLPAGTPGVLLAVSDTGDGMPQEVRERIFEPFFTTKPQGKGTGLGLSTAYGIVKQSGGYIWVSSEVGQGTTFEVYLPRTDAAPYVAVSAPEARERQRTGTILLVEDDETVRSAVRRILERSGCQVLIAHTGEEALRIAEYHPGPIDLLVTDVVMPQMNGRELSKRLRALRSDVKVLFMSGYTDEAIVQHGVLNPDVEFLQKPFGPEELARKVAEVLDLLGPRTAGDGQSGGVG